MAPVEDTRKVLYTVLKRVVYRGLVEECEGTGLPRKPRCRGCDNIKMDIKDIRRQVVDWDNLVQDKDQLCSVLNKKIKLWATRSECILDCHIRYSLDTTHSARYSSLRTSCCLYKTPTFHLTHNFIWNTRLHGKANLHGNFFYIPSEFTL